MIYRAGETITFVAYYTASGVAATGLTVSASVYKIGTAGAVATPTVSEQGGGLYYCTYTPSEDGVYVCVFSTADSSVDQQDIAGIAFRGIAGVNNLDAEISSRLASADYTEPPTADEVAIEVWDEATSTHTTPDTFGTVLKNIKSQADKLNFDPDNNVYANVADKGVLNDPSAEEIDNYLSSNHGEGLWTCETEGISHIVITLRDNTGAVIPGKNIYIKDTLSGSIVGRVTTDTSGKVETYTQIGITYEFIVLSDPNYLFTPYTFTPILEEHEITITGELHSGTLAEFDTGRVYGYIESLSGVPLVGEQVIFRLFDTPSYAGGVGLFTRQVIYTDSTGYFETVIPQNVRIQIEIPATGEKKVIMITSEGPFNISELEDLCGG